MERGNGRKKFTRAASILFGITGVILIIVGTLTVVLLENLDEIVGWVIAGTILLGVIVTGMSVFTVRRYKNPPVPSKRTQAMNIIMVTWFAAIVTTASVLGAIYLPPKPFLHPRKYTIEVPQHYRFSTQYGDLNQTVEAIIPRGLPLPTNPASYAWGESYYLRALIYLYKSTGDTKILDELITRINTIQAHSDWNGDGWPGFGTDKYTKDAGGNPLYVEYVVWDGMIWFPAMEVANIIRTNASLQANQTLAWAAANYSRVAEQILLKWDRTNWVELADYRGNQGPMGYYTSPPANDPKKGIFNRVHALGRLILAIYEYTGNASYRDRVEKIARFFKANLRAWNYTIECTRKTMYEWGYDNFGEASDTSHACIDAEFVNMCYEAGLIFTREDMTRFANTFVDFYYRGRDFQVSKVIDGVNYTNVLAHTVTGEERPKDGYYKNIRQGWLQFSPYYADHEESTYVVFQVMEDLIRGGSQGTTVQQALSWLRYAVLIDFF